jgi:hypothetical protein
MERLKELITRLNEQLERKVEPSQMLETAQLLEAELRILAAQPQPARVVPTKIAVMMPSATKINAGQPAVQMPEPRKEPVKEKERNGAAAPVNGSMNGNGAASGNSTPNIPAAAREESPAATAVLEKEKEKPVERGQWPFDPLAEKPTDRFTLSQKAREVNDIIGSGSPSLNDRLKTEVVDLKSALNDAPVRDLKKAIGVNDRYIFINQLFRGDEVMYERSLKTINGFRILPEAEYWMERELKVKLGWDENHEATRHFYQLVKRRFS